MEYLINAKADGFLFYGRDGCLYRAMYDPGAYWDDPDCSESTNGWTVEHVKLEYWNRDFPVWKM